MNRDCGHSHGIFPPDADDHCPCWEEGKGCCQCLRRVGQAAARTTEARILIPPYIPPAQVVADVYRVSSWLSGERAFVCVRGVLPAGATKVGEVLR